MFSTFKYRTLFLDRDGVINRRIPDAYVKTISEFEFLPAVPEAIALLTQQFDYIVIVTNQAGIAKGLMTENDLDKVHAHMLKIIEEAGGQIDAIYHCPELNDQNSICRKPNPTMALQAQSDFPEIVFSESVIVGDSFSDMEFGRRLGMATVLIAGKAEELGEMAVDFRFDGLRDFAGFLPDGKGMGH